MKTIADLRDTLFATIEAVKAGSMDVEKAKVINDVSKTIVDTAKVEVDYFRVVGEGNSAFLPPVGRQPQLPSSPPGNGIGSAVQQLTQGGNRG